MAQRYRRRDALIQRTLLVILFAMASFVLAQHTKAVEKIKTRQITKQNNFRFTILSFAVLVCCACVTLFKTRGIIEQRARAMQRMAPVAAYTMMAAFLMFMVGSFMLFTDIMGALGILFFVSFWGFTYNLLQISPF